VADNLPNADLSVNGEPIVFHDVVYFRADDGVHGSELWRSDGTESGTWMVKETAPGTDRESMSNVTQVGEKLYFYTGSWVEYTDLWSSDGTAEGTQKIFSHSAIGPGWTVDEWQPVGDWVYLLLRPREQTDDRRLLWRTDGTPDGTEFVMNLSSPGYLISTFIGATADTLFFARAGANNSLDLWALGLTGNLVQVGATPEFSAFGVSGEQLFFARMLGNDTSLYAADRNTGSQRLVKQLSGQDIFVSQIVPFRGGVLATVDVAGVAHLWFSDGTEQGTRMLLELGVRDILGYFIDAGEQMYFRQQSDEGQVLWITDGSVSGTSPVMPLEEWNSPFPSYSFVDRGFFYTFILVDDRYELLRSDGTPHGTVRISPDGWERPELWTFGAVPLSGDRLMFFPALPGLGNKPWIWEPLAGDANLDDRVDLNDFGLLKKELGRGEGPLLADLDFDLDVDLDDFAVLKSQFGSRLLPPLAPAAVDGWASELGLAVAYSVAERDESSNGQDDADSLRVGQRVYW